MNMLAEFCGMVETGMTMEDFRFISTDGRRDKYHIRLAAERMMNSYRRSEDKFAWYLSLTIDESDKLYMLLLRKAGERQQRRMMKRTERRAV